MFAIIQTGGKQIMVQEKETIYVEKLPEKEGNKVYFTDVLMIDDKFGKPFLKSAVVVGKIIKQGKQKKIKVIRYHPKKNINKTYGHRQPYTKVEIDQISIDGAGIKIPEVLKKVSKPAAKKATAVKKPAAAKATAVKKPAAAKKATAIKKPAAAKPAATKTTATKKPAAAKATAVKKPAAAKPAATKTTATKKPAAKK